MRKYDDRTAMYSRDVKQKRKQNARNAVRGIMRSSGRKERRSEVVVVGILNNMK
jgi:hypothetical protein